MSTAVENGLDAMSVEQRRAYARGVLDAYRDVFGVLRDVLDDSESVPLGLCGVFAALDKQIAEQIAEFTRRGVLP